MRIGIVTDEISPDIKEALTIGLGWGIKDYELRCIGANRIPYITLSELGIIQDYRRKSEIRITALSPGVFKVPLSNNATIKKEIEETLPLSFDLAGKLNCKHIIIFGFKKLPNENPDNFREAVKILTDIAQKAGQRGITLLIENEPKFWCDTSANTLKILESVNSPYLKSNWDPANAFAADESPYPEGYNRIKKFIANIHIKDILEDTSKGCVVVGDGVIDWPEQLGAIIKDKLLNHVTIETHCLPLIEKSKENLKRVNKIIASARGESVSGIGN